MSVNGEPTQHGKPHAVGARDPQPDAREGQAGPPGVAERLGVPWTPGNAGRGKGPQFKAQSGRGRQPGDWREPMNSTYGLGHSGTSARADVNQPTLTAVWEA